MARHVDVLKNFTIAYFAAAFGLRYFSPSGSTRRWNKWRIEYFPTAIIKWPDSLGFTLLVWVIRFGNVDFIEFVSGRCKLDISPKYPTYGTAFHIAAIIGRHNSAKILLKQLDKEEAGKRASLLSSGSPCGSPLQIATA